MARAKLSTTHVLAAVDLHGDWENTVAHAANLARHHGASLHLVHVIEKSHWLLRKVLDEDALTAHEAEVRAQAERKLVAMAEGLTELNCDWTLCVGKPTVQVLATLAQLDAGVLVAGMGSPSGTSLFLGGTADRLLRLSPVPIYLCGPKPPSSIDTVLAPTGLGPGGQFAIEVAMEQLRPGGTVHGLYMTALPSVMRSYSGDVMALRRKLEVIAGQELDAHIDRIDVADDRQLAGMLRTNLETVPADQTILAEARKVDADLICLALGGRGLAHGLLIGRVSEKIIRALPCALLALPDRWIADRRR